MSYTDEEAVKALRVLKDYCASWDICSEACALSDGKGGCLAGSLRKQCNVPCLPRKPKDMDMVPFDFSLKEDRDALRGRILVYDNVLLDTHEERTVSGFVHHGRQDYWEAWVLHGGYVSASTAEELLESYVFLDTDEPVGKRVGNA